MLGIVTAYILPMLVGHTLVILPSLHSPVSVSWVISLRAGMKATTRLPSCHASSSEVGSMMMFFPKQDWREEVNMIILKFN